MQQREPARMPWFKWWDGTAADMKFRMLAEQVKIPVASVLGIWAYLLEHASRHPERGTVGDVDLPLMSYTLQMSVEDIETVRNGMKRTGLVTDTGDVVKWEERQAKREKSEESGASTERVKRFREKKKAAKNKDLADGNGGNGDETPVTDETAGNGAERPKKKRKKENVNLNPSSSFGDDAVKPFDQFWQAYPRKVGKVDAQKAWAKLKPTPELVQTILEAIAAQKEGHDWKREAGEYIPHPTTWLNGGRWLDEVRAYVEPQQRQNRGQWWATKETMVDFGLTLTPPLKPNPGEHPQNFAKRIQDALDRIDRGEAPPPAAAPTPYIPPAPAGGESVLTAEQQQARRQEVLALAGSRKNLAGPAEVPLSATTDE